MPIADMEGYDKGHFKRVYESIIKKSCEDAGFRALRADDVCHTSMIHATILNQLLEADMVICDLSGKNPNVMFELGIRQAFDKPVVLIQEEGTTPIFDISPIKYINYPRDLRYDMVVNVQKEISKSLTETYEKRNSPDNINSIIRLLSITKAADLKPSGNKEHDMLLIMMAELNNIKNRIDGITFESNDISSLGFKKGKEISHILKRACQIDRDLSISGKTKEISLRSMYRKSKYLLDDSDVQTPDMKNEVDFIYRMYNHYKNLNKNIE